MSESGILRTLSSATQNNRVALLVTAIVIVAMIVDVSLARVYDLINKQPTSKLRFVIFTTITLICIFGQYFLLGFVAKKSTQIRSVAKLHIRTIHGAVMISQLVIMGVLGFLILQIAITLNYYTILLILVLWISYGLSVIVLAILAQRFLSWYASTSNPVIFLYALASILLSANATFTILYVSDILVDRPIETGPYSAGTMVFISPNSSTAAFNSAFFVTSILAFAIFWVATAALLHHYSVKIGRFRYWLIISSPLILFLTQFASYFGHIFDPLFGSDPVVLTLWVTLLFTLSKPIGGILFGIAFYSLARKFKHDIVLKNYLIVSAFGLVLIYVANQASVLLVVPFPPFGIPSVSFMGIASYLILLGIYSSAIAISQDARLRQIVRQTSKDESRMLETMGAAHMKEEIKKKVVKIIRDNSDKIMETTGLESVQSEENLKLYLEEVIKELQDRHSVSGKRGNQRTLDGK